MSGHTPSEGASWACLHGDALAYLPRLPDGYAQLVVTDPPYDSMERHRAVGTSTRLKDEWFPVLSDERLEHVFRDLYRVMAANSHLYVMTNADTMRTLVPRLESIGFRFWKPLVWNKVTIGMGYHYRATYEFVLFFEKGKRKLNDLGVSDVLTFPAVHHRKRRYPTEKPLGLMELLVSQSSNEGDVVLDPFCGSGVVGEAAIRQGRMFVGIDVADEACVVTAERLRHVSQESQRAT